MRAIYLFIIYLSFAITPAHTRSAEKNLQIKGKPTVEIVVSAPTNIRRAFNDATKKAPCYLLTPEDVKSLYRAELELIIACKAIYKNGVIPELVIQDSPNYARSLYRVENSEVHMAAETIWYEDINSKTMLYSNAVITKKHLEKGIYALDSHPIHNTPIEQLELKKFTAVIVRNWFKDIEVLKKLTPNIYSTYRYSSIYNMLKLHRADFTILSFPTNDDLSITEEEGRFKPILNIKVQLDGSRHFIFAKGKTGSQHILNLINLGLATMEQSGELEALFHASGLINDKVSAWKVLN